MKFLLLSCFVILGFISGNAQPADSPIRPSDPAYADAWNFAGVLNGRGITVLAVNASKLNGFFRGIDKAAYYRTDKGIFEVIFFPEVSSAEKINVIETRKGERYLYSFTGQPHPNPPGDTFNSSEPAKFFTHENQFILVWGNDKLYETLKETLK